MPAPVINPTTSILDYLQHQYWTFRPFASNAPTSWSIDPMAPEGMGFDPATGAITGACTVAGVYVFALRAHNADGASDPMVLTVGIESAAANPRSLAVEVDIDIVTRIARVAGVDNTAPYQHAVKANDDLIYHVRFFKGSTRMEVPMNQLAWSLKSAPDGDVLAVSGQWEQVGYGTDATYAVHCSLTDPGLISELEDIAATSTNPAQQFVGLGEFEWLQTNPSPAIGPDPLRGSSQAMRILVVNDHRQS